MIIYNTSIASARTNFGGPDIHFSVQVYWLDLIRYYYGVVANYDPLLKPYLPGYYGDVEPSITS